jgi:hypothetical protein
MDGELQNAFGNSVGKLVDQGYMSVNTSIDYSISTPAKWGTPSYILGDKYAYANVLPNIVNIDINSRYQLMNSINGEYTIVNKLNNYLKEDYPKNTLSEEELVKTCNMTMGGDKDTVELAHSIIGLLDIQKYCYILTFFASQYPYLHNLREGYTVSSPQTCKVYNMLKCLGYKESVYLLVIDKIYNKVGEYFGQNEEAISIFESFIQKTNLYEKYYASNIDHTHIKLKRDKYDKLCTS